MANIDSVFPSSQMMTPTHHEKAEWSRMAHSAYAVGQNEIGHRYSVAASMMTGSQMPLSRFDYLQAAYRQWLVFGATTWAKAR